MTALRGLREGHPEMGAEELQRLNNQVLLMIAEYHLTSASQGTHHILPVLPEGAAWLMPPLDEYLPGSFDGCRDVRVTDWAQVLRVAVWLHRLNLSATYGAEIAASPWVEDYDIGPLLEYFLMPKLSDITLEEVAARVAQENRWDMEISLRDLHEERDSLQNEIELLACARCGAGILSARVAKPMSRCHPVPPWRMHPKGRDAPLQQVRIHSPLRRE